MTKVADSLVVAADKLKTVFMSRFKKHNQKIKTVANKPIDKDEDKWTKTAKITGKVVGIGSRGVAGALDLSASGLLILSKYFVKLSDMLLLDNHVLDFMSKKYADQEIKKNKDGTDKKLSKFTKENPRIAAYLSWYLMLSILITVGVGIDTSKNKKANDGKAKIENVDDITTVVDRLSDRQHVYHNPDELSVSATDKNFSKSAWTAYDKEIIKGLPFFETFISKPKINSGEVRYTYGYGLTWVYDVSKEGNISQHACTGTWKNVAAKFTADEMLEQCQLHCERGLFPSLRNALSVNENLNDRVCVALCFAGYQGSGCIRKIASAYSGASTIQEKMDAFAKGIVNQTTKGTNIRKGVLKRRWWCAAYAVGLITSDDLVSLPLDSYSSINVSRIYKNGHFKFDKETVDYALATARTSNKQRIDEFMNTFELGRAALAQPSGRTINMDDDYLAMNQVNAREKTRVNKKIKNKNKYEYNIATRRIKSQIAESRNKSGVQKHDMDYN